MKKLLTVVLIAAFSAAAFAQKQEKKTPPRNDSEKSAASAASAPLDLAKAALEAHGGERFKNMKTLVVRGSAEVSGSPTATFPASFVLIFAGEKYRLEISNPFQPFKQVFDGRQTLSTADSFTLPPVNRLGLPLLQKIGADGFEVSSLPEKYKKKKGFRITAPEGFYTDFFIDEKTGRIKSYEASYDFNGREITTSVEIDRLQEVKGVLVPERYAQRFDLGRFTVYSSFKAKEILVDTEISDDVFTLQ